MPTTGFWEKFSLPRWSPGKLLPFLLDMNVEVRGLRGCWWPACKHDRISFRRKQSLWSAEWEWIGWPIPWVKQVWGAHIVPELPVLWAKNIFSLFTPLWAAFHPLWWWNNPNHIAIFIYFYEKDHLRLQSKITREKKKTLPLNLECNFRRCQIFISYLFIFSKDH